MAAMRRDALEQYRRSVDATDLSVSSEVVDSVTLCGCPMEVSTTPVSLSDIQMEGRIWKKTERHKLDKDDYSEWQRSAITYVLSKHNKLAEPEGSPGDLKYLEQIQNSKLQLNLIREHLYKYDFIDVLTIVTPTDVLHTNHLTGDEFDLLTEFPKLNLAHIANSCAWCNLWPPAKSPWFRTNMQYIYEFLQKNTEEKLWVKCLDEYSAYHYPHRGGPLLFGIILKRRLSGTEQALRSVAKSLTQIKIKNEKGEDVEAVTSRIKAGHEALVNASSDDRNYVPEDFPRQILQVFRTTSVPRFNKVFTDELASITNTAVKSQTMPVWTSVPELVRMANEHYKLIRDDTEHGGWNLTAQPRRRALTVQDPVPFPVRTCFNCGEEDCSLERCTKERNEARIAQNRAKFRADVAAARAARQRGGRGGRGRGNDPRGRGGGRGGRGGAHTATRQTKMVDGVPMVLNKNRKWVLDQKKV